MAVFRNYLTRFHLYLFLGVWVIFTLWTFFIARAGIDDVEAHDRLLFWTTLGTIAGPMTGAISRNFQACCLAFSLSLLPYAAGGVLLGFSAQIIRWPFERFATFLRMVLWIAGWIGWFGSGILSFLHAFE